MKSPKSTALLLGALLLLSSGLASAARLLSLLEERPPAPAFSLVDTLGQRHTLGDYQGRVLVVNFWASWCGPCREEIPSLNRAAAWLKKYGVALVAINVGERPTQIARFLERQPVDFPVLYDPDMSVSGEWDAMALPVTYVIDPEGRVVYRALGGREWDSPELLVPIRALGMAR